MKKQKILRGVLKDKEYFDFGKEKLRDGVNKGDLDPGRCIEWVRGVNNCGYGYFYYKRKQVVVHRFAYELAHGPIDSHIRLKHKCGNNVCINIDHLIVRGNDKRLRMSLPVNMVREARLWNAVHKRVPSHSSDDYKALIYKDELSSLREKILHQIKQDDSVAKKFTSNRRMEEFLMGGNVEYRVYCDLVCRLESIIGKVCK